MAAGYCHTELVGRVQQFLAGSAEEDEAAAYGLPVVNTRQADFGVNYYLRDGLKATVSYGPTIARQEHHCLGPSMQTDFNTDACYQAKLSIGPPNL